MTFLTLSAELGIIATAAALLIIAGEFDLSVGSMIGFAGVVIGLTVRELGLPLWGGIASRLRGRDPGRLPQRADRREDAAAVLHRHARLALHPARPVDRHHPRASPAARRSPTSSRTCPIPGRPRLFNGHLFTGLFQWMADQGWIATRSDGIPFVPGIPMSIVWWIGAHRRRRLRPDPDPLRQLDLRHRRRPRRRAQCRRAGRPGEDQPVHLHRLRGDAARHHPGDGGRLGRHARAACSRNSRRSSPR